MEAPPIYKPKNHVRIVTATALFDGHDAAINIMRRILQDSGAEVIHLGHNRSAQEIVDAAIQEDAHAIAVTSYQGGHVEFFKYIQDLLHERGADHIRVFGGGGGVIVPAEIDEIEAYGVAKIYSPEDGRTMGLQGMINHLLEDADRTLDVEALLEGDGPPSRENPVRLARYISAFEQAKSSQNGLLQKLQSRISGAKAAVPVVGVTGTGGAGKSSLVDELLLRFMNDFPDFTVAVISIDPSRKRTGGALLGDRIRMNSLGRGRIYMRSLATRDTQSELAESLQESIDVVKAAGFDLVIVETAGIGQGDTAIVPFVDVSLYVMTAEFGAPSQLEKIDMLDFADLVAVNKFDRRGSEDTVAYVRKQYQRNRRLFDKPLESMPVYGTMASRFNDDGLTALYRGIVDAVNEKCGADWQPGSPRPDGTVTHGSQAVVPPERVRYLSEISDTIRKYHAWVEQQAEIADRLAHFDAVIAELDSDTSSLQSRRDALAEKLDPRCQKLLDNFEHLQSDYRGDEYVYKVRDKEFRVPLYTTSLSGSRVSRVAIPSMSGQGDRLRWLLRENVPGVFPFTAGVFPFKRADEDPTRMFAGEGDAKRTNERFKYLSRNSDAKRLSTAFDSVTLYGWDPDERPDIYGKVGTSGVSICTLEDMKILYSGFDLTAPTTSVSMTINGPAPIILAFFLNTAIDQQVDKFRSEQNREPNADEAALIKADTLSAVRGTVQADILKEDQAQNTCIFATDFALRMMGDIQEYFIQHSIRNFYSVSISGFHMAEAGANPISQAAFTLANGFTYVEYYLARGMDIDDFAANLSFFFSNGMDPEYAVLNRVARRIWSVAMRDKYGANERSQKFKLHVQTSGRSLHSQEYQFNDIRTTLQALTALYDNCNSLHTNAYDEAITTPSAESVRRALAIQLIINREYGLYKNENVMQGSHIIDELTALVEEAILAEFDRITERGGVLGAMETGYQRGKIQEESMYYEHKKSDGSYPIVGVNTFVNEDADVFADTADLELSRGTEDEKRGQIERLRAFQERNKDASPEALKRLQDTATSGGNTFAELMDAVRVCSLGQITQALFEAGGQYRRSM